MDLAREFSGLKLPLKIKLVFESGVLAGERSDGNHLITLYQIRDHYFEVFCDKDFTQIEDVIMLTPDEVLRLYNL